MVNKSPDWWVKLADFGVSKRVRGENTAYHTSLIGDYVAPEIFDLIDDEDLEDNFTYTTAVDMWSLGCLSYWLLTTQTPFPGRKGLRLYCRGKMPFPSLLLRDQKLADAGILFIERLMAVLPQKRLNASDARFDPWLESVIEPAMELRRRASVEDISDTGSMAQLRDRSSGSSGSSVRSNTLAEVAPNDGDEVKSAVTTPTASQDAEIIDTSTTDVDGLITSPGGVTLTVGNDPVDRINYDVPSHSGGSGRSARSTENLDAPSLGNTALEEPTQEERHPMAAQLQSNALRAGQDNLADIDSLGAKVYEAKGSGNTDHKDEGKSSEETPELMQDVEVTDEAEEDLDSQTRDKSREDVAASVETVPGGGQPDNRTIDAPRMPRFSSAARTFDVDMPFLPLDLLERMGPVTPLASSIPDEDIMAEAGREADHQRSAQSWEDASKPSEVEEHVPLRYQLAFDKFKTRMAQSKAERKERELKHDQAERPLGAAPQNPPSEDKDLNSPVGKSWPYSHSSWQTEQDGERGLEEHYRYIPDEIGLSEGSRMHHTVPRKAVASTMSRKARVSEISGGPTAVERGSTGTDGPYGKQGNFEVVEERDLDGKLRPKLAFRNQHGLIGLTLDSIPRIVAAEQAKEQRPDAYRHAYSSLTTWIKQLKKKPGSVTSIGSPESSSPKPAKRGSYGAAKRNSYGSSVDNVVTQVRSEPDTAKVAVSAHISTEPVNASPVIFSTPSEEINALSCAFQTQWLPKCKQFIESPPSDQKTRKSLYTQLAEALESQILNKSENINVYHGQDVAEIVRLNDDVTTILQELEDAASRWVALPFKPGG